MIPDDIKQKIKAVAEKQRSPFAYTVIAEYGYSLAQQEISDFKYERMNLEMQIGKREKEIERLKELLMNEYCESRIPNLVSINYSNKEARETVLLQWQQFKTDNQL